MKDLLCLKGVSLVYHSKEGETLAVKDLSFCLRKNEYLSVVGPSGCGKTTVLSLISGLLRPSDGHVYIGGEEVIKPSASVGYMLQRDQLFEWRTIRENVVLGLEIQRKKNAATLAFADNLLDKYGLSEFKSHYPRQLSGGMRQRVALIRTLAVNPDILLLDEPFSAIDYQTRLKVCDDVYRIIKGEHKSAVLVTHDISEAVSMSDRVLVLSARPANVRNIFTMSFADCDTPLARRENKKFPAQFDKIWKELNADETVLS